MKGSLAIILGIILAPALPNANAQQVLKDKAYRILVPSGWTRTESVPTGLDVGFRKPLPQGGWATFYFHHEIMPLELGEEPPSDTSDMKRQWDAMVRNQYPDVRSMAEHVPKVNGTILVNAAYELTDGGTKVRRRYTYFLADSTAFVVQCSAPPGQWARVSTDFDAMLASLQPGSSSPEAEAKSDESAEAELQRNLPTLLGSFPRDWRCSLSKVAITPGSPKAERSLEIALSFDRRDIGDIYKATRTVFGMVKAGKTDADLNRLPADTQKAASNSGEFIKYVGQVWGYAGGYVAASCTPPVERYRIYILDSKGKRVGSVSISRVDGSAILTGKVSASEGQRVVGMYVFE